MVKAHQLEGFVSVGMETMSQSPPMTFVFSRFTKYANLCFPTTTADHVNTVMSSWKVLYYSNFYCLFVGEFDKTEYPTNDNFVYQNPTYKNNM